MIPEDIKHDLIRLLIHADTAVIQLLEQNDLDLNIVLEEGHATIFTRAVGVLSEYQDSDEQLQIIKYLLDNGADPNLKDQYGNYPLHIALAHHTLSKVSLLLIRSDRVDVEVADKHGSNPVFVAVREYGKTWREDQKELNLLRFEIIEELLKRGANPDRLNMHGISSRRWLDIYEDEKLQDLIGRYD